MTFFRFSPALSLSLCAVLAAQAQDTAPAPSPATDHDHAGDAHLLDSLVVTATPVARSQSELIGSTHVLTGDALLDARQPSLGETLAGLPGVSSTYFGPGASRPVLRGLGAHRVRVLANSTDTLDASNASPDHAVALEPFLVRRIEVVRGPASLLYGSDAIGGVVNVIDHRTPAALPERPVSGLLESSLTDNGSGYAAGGSLDVALGADPAAPSGLVLHLDGFRREADDLEVPGASGQEDAPRGRLLNSDLATRGGSVGLSHLSDTLDLGLNVNGLDHLYGIPPEHDEVVDVNLRQRRLDGFATYKRDFGVFEEARLKLGHADYRHVEFENGEREGTFENRGVDGRFELINGDIGGWTGALGTQLHSAKLTTSEEAFRTTQGALFAFQERAFGETTAQLGARDEHHRVRADEFATTDPLAGTFDARGEDRTTLGASVGAIYRLGEAHRAFASYSYTERAPTGQELYAHGKHHGTHAYEIGDPDLDLERGHGFEIGLRRVQGTVTGSLSGFAHFFDGYIYERETGLDVDENNQLVPDPAPPGTETYHRVVFSQTDALFYGAEAEAVWHLHAESRHTLDFTTGLDYVRATDASGDPLPRIPPLKGRLALDWRLGPWRAGADATLVAPQRDTAPDEDHTDGHALLGLSLGYCLETPHATYDFVLRGANLADQEARVHSSFLKDIAPLPGRAFTAGVRASF